MASASIGSDAVHLLAPLRLDLSRWPPAAQQTVSLADSDRAYSSLPPYARARYVLSKGVLYKANSRCVYRRDETTAWALLQLLERYPHLPDFDIVLNCRDGPLMRKPRAASPSRGLRLATHMPLVLAYSSTLVHSEIAFPDYTLWGLPGKIKPWAQLRLDLLHRAQRPYARRLPRAIATGVINEYHSSLGVRARQAVQQCATGRSADPRLDIRYHRLYFKRWYSTEEHCAHKYILLSPGSHAVWLDHLKQKLLCGSLVMLLEPPASTVPPNHVQFDVLTRLITPGVHYLSIPLPDLSPPDNKKRGSHKRFAVSQKMLCEQIRSALDWAEDNPSAAEAIANAGRALVRDSLTMEAVYAYMEATVAHAARLLSYAPADAISTHRIIPWPKKNWPFNASNWTAMPRDPEAFAMTLRNDSLTYPITAQIGEREWADVVLRYNYSRMGLDFSTSASALQAEVRLIIAEQERAEALRKKEAESKRQELQAAQGKRRGRGRVAKVGVMHNNGLS